MFVLWKGMLETMNKILLIEDDSTIRMGLKYYLEEERL